MYNDDQEDISLEIIDEETLQRQRQLKAKQKAVGLASKRKGGRYENDLARKIGSYFGWNGHDMFILAKNHPQFGQRQGDLVPIKQMAVLWMERKLGVIEAKNREEWAFNQFFKDDLTKNPIYRYWKESNDNTQTENSLIFFTKNHVNDFVFHRQGDAEVLSTYLTLTIEDIVFIIQTLGSFLQANFPQK